MTFPQIRTCLAMLWKKQFSQVLLVFSPSPACRNANRDSLKCFCHFLIKNKVISAERETSMVLMFCSLSVR